MAIETTLDTGTEELLCQVRNRVATVTLNRPEKKNALGDSMTPALREILPILEARSDVGCVLLTGAGEAFCSGGDVGGMAEGSAETRRKSQQEHVEDLIRRQEELTLRLHEFAKPTIAALPGPAAGAGLSIALSCDLRVAKRSAFMLTAFAKLGISGDYGASWFLDQLVGPSKAKELLYFSERISAEECLGLGLVNAVFENEAFREDATEYAERLANGPTLALSRMKLNVRRGGSQSLREALALEAEHMVASFQSEDAHEAIRAFVERRKPEFKFR
jgi:enoyl-CoA hydratase/carnithine racemase